MAVKPDVIFFGESIHNSIKNRLSVSPPSHSVLMLIFPLSRFGDAEECDRLLVDGTTLATYLVFQIVKHTLELKKPVFVLNTGPTWADELLGSRRWMG